MADYGVNIAVAVKNTEAITALTRKIKLTTSQVGQLNNFLVNFNDWRLGPAVVNSVDNFSKALKDARDNLNSAALGSKEAADAARDFARAQDLANDALREQAALLAQVRNEGRSGTLRGGTQYSGPIGPGFGGFPATKPGDVSMPILQGQSSAMRPQSLLFGGRSVDITGLNERNLAIQRDNLILEKAFFDLERKQADRLNDQLRLRKSINGELAQEAANVQAVIDKARQRQEFLQGKSGALQKPLAGAGAFGFPVALSPTQQERAAAAAAEGRKSVMEQLAVMNQIDEQLDKQRKIGLAITAEERKQAKARQESLALQQREERTERKIEEAIKRGTNAQERRQKLKSAQGSALIGGAFPLLFGQGLGASVGGAAGGFAGGMIGGEFGFGLSLVGTAIGNAFDEAQRRVKEMGNALRTLDLSKLEESAIRISEQLKFQVEKFKEAGDFVRARALLEQTVAQQTGSTATVIKDIANSGNLLKAAFDEVVASGSVLLGAVAAPFSAVLAGILKLVAEIFKIVNRGISFVGGLLREVEKIIDPGRNIQKAIESIAPAVAEATVEMKKFAEELRRTLALAQQTADLDLAAARIGPGNSAENQLARNRIDYQRQLSSIQEDINNKLKEANKLTGQERIDAVRSIKLLEAKNKRTAELLFIGAKIKIQSQERLRAQQALLEAQQALLEVEERKARIVQTRLKDVNEELAALRAKQHIEQELLNLPISAPTPFTGPTPEMIRQQQMDLVDRNKRNQLDNLNAQNLTEEVRSAKELAIIRQAELEVARIGLEFTNRKRQAQENLLIAAQNEINLIDARMAGNEAEVLVLQQIEEIQRTVGTLDAAEIQNLKEKLFLLEQRKKLEKEFNLQQEARVAGAGLGAGFIGQAGQAFEKTLLEGGSQEEAKKIAQLTEQLALAQMQAATLEQAVVGIGNAFATAMTTGVQELVRGTKSAEEVFADFLNNVANILMQAAQQMIAMYIAIGVARLFAGMGSGGGGETTPPTTVPGSASQSGLGLNIGGVDQGISPFGPGSVAIASGGYFSGPTRALVGEGGQGEYVIPENKMRESMARYSRGARGSAVIPETGGSGTSGEGGGTAVAAPIDVRYTVERINSVDYVTADQFQAGMQQAANQGAKQGEQQTLKRLQMSSSTRKRLGM